MRETQHITPSPFVMMVLRIGIIVATGLRTAHAFALPSNTSPYSTSALSARGKFDPFTNMLGDVASNIMGGQASGPKNPQLDITLESLSTSWDEVRSTLTSLQTPEERQFRELLKTGRGPPSPLHKVRLYDDSNTEDDIRVTFYRDSASWCPYCHVGALEKLC
jgi:glutathione S-transferase